MHESVSWVGYISGLIVGGINYQTEHHVAPAVDPTYYHYIAPELRRICKAHWDQRQRRRKNGTDVASMLASLRVRLRRSATPWLSRTWSRADVADVLRRAGYAPPYFQREGRLCIVAADPKRPLTPDNATLVRSNRCRGRHHLPTAAAQGRRRPAARR